MANIPFNKPYLSGKELDYIRQAVDTGKISGNGLFTKKCQDYFCATYGFAGALLTTSCTDALEMAALLAKVGPGDEVIMPSFTFVSTANAFVLRGAKIVFADSEALNPNLDCKAVEALLTERTKVIVPVHYAGVACDMDPLMVLAEKHGIVIVEDAAQAIDSFYKDQPLGGVGHLAAFSFHETKNIICGEGGMLAINDPQYSSRAEIVWEKGTNRSAFWRGEVDKYGWVDLGSSFLPSEITAAFLYAQLEQLAQVQSRRKFIWSTYQEALDGLEKKGKIRLPVIPAYATNNAHMFYLVCLNGQERDGLIAHLKKNGCQAVFHYQCLHSSPFYKEKHDGRVLAHADHFSNCLVRLPLFYELTEAEQRSIIDSIMEYYGEP